MPGTLTRPTRIWLSEMSKVCCSESVVLPMPYCRTGTVAASYWMMSGGVAPGGSCLRMLGDRPGTGPHALETVTQAGRKSLRLPIQRYDEDSMSPILFL